MIYEGRVLGFEDSGNPDVTVVRIMDSYGFPQDYFCDPETVAKPLKRHLGEWIRYTLDEFEALLESFEPIKEA